MANNLRPASSINDLSTQAHMQLSARLESIDLTPLLIRTLGSNLPASIMPYLIWELDMMIPSVPRYTSGPYQRRNYDPDGGCPCGALYATDSISGGAAYRGHTESKLASRSERCSGHRERCAPVDNPGDLKATSLNTALRCLSRTAVLLHSFPSLQCGAVSLPQAGRSSCTICMSWQQCSPLVCLRFGVPVQ